MAVYHRVFTFNPEKINTLIKNRFFNHGKLNEVEFLAWIKSLVANQSEAMAYALNGMILHDGYLIHPEPEEDIAYTHDWYLFALTAHLKEAPSLNEGMDNKPPYPWGVLEYTLSTFDWTEEQIKLLTRGENLDIMLKKYSSPILYQEFWGLSFLGSWLSLEDCQFFLKKLNASEKILSEATDQLFDNLDNDRKEYLMQFGSDSILEMTKDAVQKAKIMLNTAIRRSEPLFIIVN